MTMYFLIFQRLALEAFFDILYFPVWWYSGGAVRAARRSWQYFLLGNSRLAPALWLRNIFVPMFGQYDWQGRIISFVMRVIQVIFRSFALFVWLGVCFVIFLVWLVIPLFVAYRLALALGKTF